MIKVIMVITALAADAENKTTITMELPYGSIASCVDDMPGAYVAAMASGVDVQKIECVQRAEY